jgi:UDP-N-acetylmuramyl tripeptide synthase
MDANETNEEFPTAKFQSILQVDVPKGRDGKHKKIVQELIEGIEQLQHGTALKVPLAELPDTKENIRSALSRATRQRDIDIATSSDENYLYVWKNRS